VLCCCLIRFCSAEVWLRERGEAEAAAAGVQVPQGHPLPGGAARHHHRRRRDRQWQVHADSSGMSVGAYRGFIVSHLIVPRAMGKVLRAALCG